MEQILETVNNLWKMYAELMRTQPVVAGMFTLYGMGVFTYIFKSIPSRIITYIKYQFTVGVAIHNNDMLFDYATRWLENGNKVFRCKSFTATMIQSREKNSILISVGNGNHIFFHRGRPFWLSRVEKEAQNTTERKESLFVSTIGWKPDSIKNFLQEVVPQPKKDSATAVYTFSDNYWSSETSRARRKLDTVILSDENEKKLREHITQYMNEKGWYKGKFIPWRTGIILQGPPGTGKSTISLALCGEFDCNLFIANLSMVSDDRLMKMFKGLPPKSIMLIEDIDSYGIATSRKKTRANRSSTSGRPVATKNEEGDEETEMSAGKLFGSLSGLLNAIDGICATEDRILIATTNHIEKLDPALIRPGRFELILKIDNLDDETGRKIFKKFYPDFKLPATFKMREGISPVQFQTMAIGNKNNPKALFDFCNDSNFVHKNLQREEADT